MRHHNTRYNRRLQPAIGLCLALLSCQALAQSPEVHEAIDEQRWRYRLTPYVWGAGLQGTVGASGRRAEVERSFSEVLDSLDAGAMLAFEARRGRFGLFADLLHVRLSDSARVPTPLGIDLSGDARVHATTFMLAGQYRLTTRDRGYLDLVGGVRHWALRTEVDARLGSLLSVSGRDRERWSDPVLGLKGTYHLNKHLYLTGWAMAGGFEVGSQFSTDLMGAVGYRLGRQSTLLLGYRNLQVDYQSSSFTFDATLRGPALGWDYRF